VTGKYFGFNSIYGRDA